jgi:hypothetical protein
MKARIYVDASVIGGCEDDEFVNLHRIHGYNSVNLRRGYPTLEIRAPLEVLPNE